MLDTKLAIDILQAMLNTVQSNVTGFQGQADALTTAISLLNGTLKTQLDELEAKKTELDTATAQIVDLQTQLQNAKVDSVVIDSAVPTP